MVIPEPNPRESEDSSTLFFRSMLLLVTGYIYLPVFISFYLIAMLNAAQYRNRASFDTLDLKTQLDRRQKSEHRSPRFRISEFGVSIILRQSRNLIPALIKHHASVHMSLVRRKECHLNYR